MAPSRRASDVDDYGLVAAIEHMQRSVEGAMLPLMLDIGEAVAVGAQTAHPWRNRTGRLERSIGHGAASGSLRSGYRVDVTARTRYASYLENGTSRMPPYPYLWPSWERHEAWAVQHTETVLTAALATG